MRWGLGWAAALALLVTGPGASAQDPPGVNLPDAPIPYVKVRPAPKAKARPAPRPAARPTASATAAAPAAAAAAAAPSIPGAVPLAAGVVPATPGARLAPGQPLNPAEVEAFADGLIRSAMAREHVAGVSVAVVQNGQVVLKKGYGFADLKDRQAVDPDRTLFRIGSISKTFTWIALMQQVEAGRIRLHAPVNQYLPERARVRRQGFERDVRVIHLLDHSGGWEDRALGQLFERDPNRIRPVDLYLRQEQPRRVREPGVLPTYSNYGATLAGQAAAGVTGQGFERLVESRITGPLGMTRTTFREPRPERRGLPGAMPEALRPDVAVGYRWTATGFKPRANEYIGQVAPAGSASSTAGDMSRYMIMLLNNGAYGGTTVFGPQAARAFRTPLQRTPPGVNGWAHGFMTYDLPGGFRGFGHGGDTLAFHSNMVLVPALNLGIFITTNSDDGYRLAGALPDQLVRQFYAAPQVFPRGGSAELRAAAGVYEGYYVGTRRAYRGLEKFATLMMGGVTVGVTPDGRLLTSGQQPQTWAAEGPAGAGRFIATMGDQRIAFDVRDGRARSFRTASNTATFERAAAWMRPQLLALSAGLTAAAALATLLGVFLRRRHVLRENQTQSRAGIVQNIQAGLWLATFVLTAVWGMEALDVEAVMYGWPGPLLILASTCALMASLLTIVTLVALPAVWQGGRRVDSWSSSRKAFFTLTVLIYGTFATLLLLWGALTPWSS